MESKHEYYLERLVKNLPIIDEDPRDIEWIMKDGIWLKKGSRVRRKLCDLIVVYFDRTAIPIELKGSMKKRGKAKEQLESGRMFAKDVLGLYVPYTKLVIYTGKGYDCEVIA